MNIIDERVFLGYGEGEFVVDGVRFVVFVDVVIGVVCYLVVYVWGDGDGVDVC